MGIISGTFDTGETLAGVTGDAPTFGSAGATTLSGTGLYFFPQIADYLTTGISNTEVISPVANGVYVFRFIIPVPMTFVELDLDVITAVAANQFAIAVYSSDGLTKLIDTGPLTTVGTGIRALPFAATTLPPGAYLLARTCSSVVAILRAFATNSTFTPILNTTVVHQGRAANNSAAGVMPATLGAITLDSGLNPTIIKLQG